MKINDRKPILFEKSDHNIWTDPYIQQQMLKKHLIFTPTKQAEGKNTS